MQSQKTQEEFARLTEDHRGILFKVCQLYGTSYEDREDLAQEVMVQLWRSFPAFDGRCAFSTWMYRVALNTAISWLRHDSLRRRHIEASGEQLLLRVPAKDTDSEELRVLYDLIGSLDPVQKAMVMLHLDGNTHQEIADVLGTTPTNIATRMNRLKNSWKQKLAQ